MIEQVIIENFQSTSYCQLILVKLNILISSNGVIKSKFISFFELANAIYNLKSNQYNKGFIEYTGNYFNAEHFDAKNYDG